MRAAPLELRPFASGPHTAGARLEATIEREGGRLVLRYRLYDPDRRALLSGAPSGGRADRLWEHTCFEAFLAPRGARTYWEVNLSPDGSWNVYRFADYRAGMEAEPRVADPAMRRDDGAGRLGLEVKIDLGRVDALASAPIEAGLAAILESHDGRLSHWALRHGGERPDFHRRDSFVVSLPLGRSAA